MKLTIGIILRRTIGVISTMIILSTFAFGAYAAYENGWLVTILGFIGCAVIVLSIAGIFWGFNRN